MGECFASEILEAMLLYYGKCCNVLVTFEYDILPQDISIDIIIQNVINRSIR